MRVILAVLLTAVLAIEQVAAQQTAQGSGVKQQIAATSKKALVEVSTRAGSIVRGHIVSRADADFTLRQEKGGTTQTIGYDQVLSVSRIKAGHSYKTWIIVGVVVIGVVVIVALVVRNSCGHICGA